MFFEKGGFKLNEVKRTPLYEKHLESHGTIVEFSGYELPIQYIGIAEEHEAVRNAAGLFDVSHMGEVIVTGKDAFKYVQNLVSNDVSTLENNQILYTVMCYPNGYVVDDLLVYKFSDTHFYLVINAANVEKDYQWMVKQKSDYDITLDNQSSKISQLALQGPKAQDILQKLVDFDLFDIKFFYCKRDVKIKDINAIVSRTGYTGEDGFEIYVSNEDAPELWDLLLENGKNEGLMPIGLGARDTLRFEACLPLYGHEISDSINPLEAGLSMFVKLDGDDFIGRDSLIKAKENGLKRKLVGLELPKGIAREGYPVLYGDKIIGHVTTGYKSPTINKSVALALIDIEHSKMGTNLNVEVRKKVLPAIVVSKRFYKKNYKK